MSDYNGFTNYETWAVNLHYGEELKESLEGRTFSSMYEAQCYLREQIEERIEEAIMKTGNDYFISDLLWASAGECDFRQLAELYSDQYTIEVAA